MVGEITTDNQTASVDHQTRAFARLVDRTGDVQLPGGLAEVPIEIASTSEITVNTTVAGTAPQRFIL